MVSFWSTSKFLFLSILILSTGAAYLYISYSRGDLSLNKMVSGALASYRERDDWGNLAEAEKEQSRRLATLKAYCKKNLSMVELSKSKHEGHVYFYDNIKTIYCYIPKVGCKTMKLLFYNLEHNETLRLNTDGTAELRPKIDNFTDPKLRRSGYIHSRGFKTFNHYSKEEVGLRLATYKKIIVVRDPLERLASAWLGKFVTLPETSGFLGWTKGLNQRLRKYQESNLTNKSNNVKDEGTFNVTKRVSFRDFLFSVSKRIIIDNEHWMSFSRLCLPCQIDYDFIAHMDTVASDVRLFVKKYNITANEEVLPEQRRRHVHDDNVFNKIYAQVPIEEILPLRETFQEDFDMFGYSFEQDLIKILQGKSTG
ncbi:PREDICTED: carbohydrate sulfotransferase 12-like [Branchiostoma belcheri]|uniref:Carbohydrate sulfotransferase n=1 Tax=Branchiostoma belcheri TaxID=7741 RepID=A0A6P4YBZ3_BRABE|nr:PREDICTED: carbohydrate sulfotransferase 12-like [Branchiostoma belcheri]